MKQNMRTNNNKGFMVENDKRLGIVIVENE